MAIKLSKNNLCVNQIIGQKTEKIVVEGDEIVPDIKPDILSVVSTNGNICIYKKEVQDGIVIKKAVYIALGVTMTGEKEILGFYIGDSESAKYWTSILNELKNRGVKDILILCADGLKGLKEAIGTVYPTTEFQRCIVHMIRNTLQYVSYKDRKGLAQDLKQIYQASTEEIGYNNLIELEEKWKKRKVSLENWINNWDNIQPFF